MGTTALKRLLATLLAGLAMPAGAAASVTAANWDTAQQTTVVRARLMSNLGPSFGGGGTLSAAQANAAIAALGRHLGGAAGHAAAARHNPVALTSFDGMLVNELGLTDVAAHVQSVASAAGLKPPAYFGSEAVARLLGFRYDHPAGTDQLELFPTDAITRAEAAWSLAHIYAFTGWEVPYARTTFDAFDLPALSADELTPLRIAAGRIGFPYVWGGTTDDTSDGLAHGGFDCSGLVWRVYKLSGLSWGVAIAGRTAAQQAGEIPKSQRLRISRLLPGDLLFFGSAHFGDRATEANITHEGIYLGDNWVIHASGQGVNISPLSGSWLGDSFAWGRRVIT